MLSTGLLSGVGCDVTNPQPKPGITYDGPSLALRVSSAVAVSAVLLFSACAWGADTVASPLAKAHAHNDYLHARPLLDALDHGFTNVEADIFLVDGKLLVAHEKKSLKPERTLEALYLEPLRQRAKEHGGSIYPGGGPFTLLVDIKSDGESTYAALVKVLADYADIVSVVRGSKLHRKAVDVVISGSRPRETMEAEVVRYAGYDGRLSDLDSEISTEFMPLVSDNWMTAFKWRGQGPISDAEKMKLDDAVAKAHAQGRRIRFWATPERVEVWRQLNESGVDLINTDDLAGLEKFLREQK
jgi:hypothetical protein